MMSTDPNVVYLPHLGIDMYEPDFEDVRADWKRKRGWRTDPVVPPYKPHELVEYYQERANRITRQLRDEPLLAYAQRPFLWKEKVI